MDSLAKPKLGCVVPGAASYTSKQGSVYAPGISKETVRSQALFLGMVTIPPEGRTKAHIHERHESAFYMLSGDEVELYTGDELEHKDVAHPGDYFSFLPAFPMSQSIVVRRHPPSSSVRATSRRLRKVSTCVRTSTPECLEAGR